MESNVYIKNYNKYANLVGNFSGDYSELAKLVEALTVAKSDSEEERKAMILFGFSGNGKSTWIKNFKKDNPDYMILSMDTVVKSASQMLGRKLKDEEVIIYFSGALDYVFSRGKNVIIDGNFLNLVTRMILVDSLHMHGYDVSLVDITPLLDVTLDRRIMDVASVTIGVPITFENVDSYRDNPLFLSAKQSVMKHYENERSSAYYDEQMLLGLTPVGVERVITVGDSKQGSVGGKKH